MDGADYLAAAERSVSRVPGLEGLAPLPTAVVGVIGGAPKCSKTWLGLDLALSVATGTACLGRYAVPRPGPVLIYLAEDALAVVRERVEGMARHRGLELAGVEIHVITAPALRLDRQPHRQRLLETAQRLRPRLLLLDPLVREPHPSTSLASRTLRPVLTSARTALRVSSPTLASSSPFVSANLGS